MLIRRAAVLAILLSTLGFLQWPAWSTPQEPCEPLLVSANIEGLVRLAEQSGLGTVEIQAWSLRSVPGPIEFRQTLNSSQLAVVQGFRRVAASATLSSWPEIQRRVAKSLGESAAQAEVRVEARERTAALPNPQLVHTWETEDIDDITAPISDGGENIWFAYLDRDRRVHQVDWKTGADIIANPNRFTGWFLADARLISRGPGEMPFYHHARKEDRKVIVRLVYGSEPYSFESEARFESSHLATIDNRTNVVAWSPHERFAFRMLDVTRGGEVVDLTGRAKLLETRTKVSPYSFLKTKDGRLLLAISTRDGLQVLRYKGDHWSEVVRRPFGEFLSPVLAEGLEGEVWVAGIQTGSLGEDTLKVLEISNPEARVWEAPYHHVNLFSPLKLAIDENGLPWVSAAGFNHYEEPRDSYRVYNFDSNGKGSYRILSRNQFDENYPFDEWIRDPQGRLYLALHEPGLLKILDPYTLQSVASIPILDFNKAVTVSSPDNTYVMIKKNSTRVDLYRIFSPRF